MVRGTRTFFCNCLLLLFPGGHLVVLLCASYNPGQFPASLVFATVRPEWLNVSRPLLCLSLGRNFAEPRCYRRLVLIQRYRRNICSNYFSQDGTGINVKLHFESLQRDAQTEICYWRLDIVPKLYSSKRFIHVGRKNYHTH